MSWKDYELYITRHFQRLFPDASISHNVKRVGVVSQTKRQIDILIEQSIAGVTLTIIVDCKLFNKKVTINHVESFLSFLRDVKASKGILITNVGYTKGASKRAKYDTQDIELRIIDFRDLEQYQAFIAVPYSGSHCAIVSTPDGWIVDGTQVSNVSCATFYPVGLSLDEALHTKEFIYLVFSHKDKNWPNLPHLLEVHKNNSYLHYRNPKIEYLDGVYRSDCVSLWRVIDAVEMGDTIEHTVFLDFPTVVIFLTLSTPRSKESEYTQKLRWICEKLIKGNIIVNEKGEPCNIGNGSGETREE